MASFYSLSIVLSMFISSVANIGFVAEPTACLISKPDSIIVLDPFPIPGNDIPRSPTVVPISASYEPMLSSVFLTFTSNLGEIKVEVMNTTTGGYFSDFVDTQFLYATIPIIMGPGHYILLFTLPSGQRYKGEFDL